MVARKLLGPKTFAPYVPDFSLAFNHICIHTGEGAEAPAGPHVALTCWFLSRHSQNQSNPNRPKPTQTNPCQPEQTKQGGRAVLDTMEKQMQLSKEVMEPSRAGLYRWGWLFLTLMTQRPGAGIAAWGADGCAPDHLQHKNCFHRTDPLAKTAAPQEAAHGNRPP
jgi:hypothetical protein